MLQMNLLWLVGSLLVVCGVLEGKKKGKDGLFSSDTLKCLVCQSLVEEIEFLINKVIIFINFILFLFISNYFLNIIIKHCKLRITNKVIGRGVLLFHCDCQVCPYHSTFFLQSLFLFWLLVIILHRFWIRLVKNGILVFFLSSLTWNCLLRFYELFSIKKRKPIKPT